MSRALLLLAALLLALGPAPGCRKSRQPAGSPPDKGAAAPDRGPRRPAPTRYEACARLEPPPAGKVKPITLGGVRLVPDGPVLRPAPDQPRSAGQHLVLGVLGALHRADAKNLARLRAVRDHLVGQGAQGIVVLGGLDPEYQGIRALLGALHGLVPLLALPGELESRSGFSGALENLGAGVVDFTLVRAVLHPAATLVGVPGYHLVHHLTARQQGCSYDGLDLAELAALARDLPRPRVLLAHGPPRMSGPHALDRAFGGINAGDPLLTRLLQDGGFSHGFFSHLHESAGRSLTSGAGPLAAGIGALLLNVGSADATPHQHLDGTTSRGTAALVTLSMGWATHRIIDLAKLGKPAEKRGIN